MLAPGEPSAADLARLEILPDIELVRLLKSGQDEALGVLLRRHSEALYRFCCHLMHNRDDAEDVAQETMARAITRVDGLQSGSVFRSWLFSIARNLSVDSYRVRKRLTPLPDDDSSPIILYQDSPYEQVETHEEYKTVAKALGKLAKSHQNVLMLREVEGLSYAEIAQRLDVSQSAVETLLFRARRRLREEYTKRSAPVPTFTLLGALRNLVSRAWGPVSGGAPLAAKLASVAVVIGAVASAPHVAHLIVGSYMNSLPSIAIKPDIGSLRTSRRTVVLNTHTRHSTASRIKGGHHVATEIGGRHLGTAYRRSHMASSQSTATIAASRVNVTHRAGDGGQSVVSGNRSRDHSAAGSASSQAVAASRFADQLPGPGMRGSSRLPRSPSVRGSGTGRAPNGPVSSGAGNRNGSDLGSSHNGTNLTSGSTSTPLNGVLGVLPTVTPVVSGLGPQIQVTVPVTVGKTTGGVEAAVGASGASAQATVSSVATQVQGTAKSAVGSVSGTSKSLPTVTVPTPSTKLPVQGPSPVAKAPTPVVKATIQPIKIPTPSLSHIP